MPSVDQDVRNHQTILQEYWKKAHSRLYVRILEAKGHIAKQDVQGVLYLSLED